jgi:hypothetical protein
MLRKLENYSERLANARMKKFSSKLHPQYTQSTKPCVPTTIPGKAKGQRPRQKPKENSNLRSKGKDKR